MSILKLEKLVSSFFVLLQRNEFCEADNNHDVKMKII